MKENKNERENSRPVLCISSVENEKFKIVSTRFGLSLYNGQISKTTKIPSIPKIHEGQNGKKITKGKSKGGQKGKKIKKHFRTVRKFRTLLRSALSSFFYSSVLLNSDLQC